MKATVSFVLAGNNAYLPGYFNSFLTLPAIGMCS